MTDFEMPEAALIRQLRERLGDEQADACVADFITYLNALGDSTYRRAWDTVCADTPITSEHILERAARVSRDFKGTALRLTAYVETLRPVTLADAPPAWAASTQVLLPMVPGSG